MIKSKIIVSVLVAIWLGCAIAAVALRDQPLPEHKTLGDVGTEWFERTTGIDITPEAEPFFK